MNGVRFGQGTPLWKLAGPDSEPSTATKENAATSKSNAELQRAASMFEELFLRELIKVMRETVPESSMFGSSLGQNISTEMFDGAIAEEISAGSGTGIREALADQLRAGFGISTNSQTTITSLLSPKRASQALKRTAGLVDATQLGKSELTGIAFESPNRPEPVRLTDSDGHLIAPVATAQATVSDNGIIHCALGEPVLAAGSGQIRSSTPTDLVIDHGNGTTSHYHGLGKVMAQSGDLVLRGQTLGTVGDNGQFQYETKSSEASVAASNHSRSGDGEAISNLSD